MIDARIEAILTDCHWLADNDALLARAAVVAGDFEITLRTEGFGTLMHLILEQQISIDAAAAMFRRLTETLGVAEPERLLTLDLATLKRCGFTIQKAGYARGISERVLDGSFSFEALGDMQTEEATAALVSLRGIGPWTAANYLLWAQGRRDIFPPGDLALRAAWNWLHDREGLADDAALVERAAAWSPRRTGAAFLLWHCYLVVRGRTAPD